MTTFDIRLFGAIEIRRDGVLLTDFRSQKALVLLAYLICENRPVTRDYLAGLAWPEMEQSQALGLLRRSLHDLNSQLPGCLLIDRRTVCFSPSAPATVDIHQLTHWLTLNDLAGWVEAVARYPAPFLHGIYVDDAPELESWLLREQERWQQAATRVLQQLIQHHTDEAAYMLALGYVQQLLALEPWREEAQRQAMLLLARTGQVSAALAQYERCRKILQEELAVEPDRETETLYARIKALTRIPPANLPPPTTRFVGRQDELAQLTLLLAKPHCRLITIMGAGGMGKTRLALEVARKVTSHEHHTFLHGVAFVALASVDTPEQMIATVAHALAFTFQTQGNLETQLLSYLKDKELLLLLDNFEHLMGTHTLAFVLKLLQTAPDVKVLITSRVRLNLQDEQLYWLQGLHFPATPAHHETLSLTDLAKYSGLQLFMESARRVLLSSMLSTEDISAIVAICQLVQGMPLAIELAAAWTCVLAPAKIVTEMNRTLDFLASEMHDLPLRQRSMRAVFDTSWHLLTATEQAVYQKLSIFRNGFTHQATEQVAGASLSMLAILVNKSLLQYDRHSNRYSIHDLLRQYGAERLAQAPEADKVVRELHSTYYCTLLTTQADTLNFVQEPPTHMPIAADFENISAAWAWATVCGQIEKLSNTVNCLAMFFMRLTRCQEGIVHFRKTVAKLEELCTCYPKDTHLLFVYAQVLAYYGNFVDLVGNRAEARELLHKSLQYFQLSGLTEMDTRALRAFILGWLGDILHGDEAQQYYTQALALSRSVRDEQHVAEILLAQSRLMLTANLNTVTEAKNLAAEALSIHYRLDDKTGIAWSLHTLSCVALYQGDYKTCEQMSRESLTIHQQLEQKDGVAYRLGMLAQTTLLAGKFTETQIYAKEALAIWTDLGFQGHALEAELVLGLAFLHQGDYAAARLQAENSLRSAQELGRSEETANAFCLLGKVALAEEYYIEAQCYLQESLKLYQAMSLRSDIAWVLAHLALTAYNLGNQMAARQHLMEAIPITLRIQRFSVILRVLPMAALLLAEAGHIKQATKVYEWTERQPFIANSRWLLGLVGRRLETLLGPLSPSTDNASPPMSNLNAWKTLASQLHTDFVTLDWSACEKV